MNVNKRRTGSIVLILAGILFWVLEAVAAAAWKDPAYSYTYNWVSDLGVPVETVMNGHAVNSPLFALMNLNFILFGAMYIAGFWMILPQYQSRQRAAAIGALATGLGVFFVAAFPGYSEYSGAFMHGVGAMLVVFGCFALALASAKGLGEAVKAKWYAPLCYLTAALIAVGLVMTFALSESNYGGLVERVLLYPVVAFPVITGIAIVTGRDLHRI